MAILIHNISMNECEIFTIQRQVLKIKIFVPKHQYIHIKGPYKYGNDCVNYI